MAQVFDGRIQVHARTDSGVMGDARFGYTRNNGATWHGGIDITCPDQPSDNTPVHAIDDGTISQSRIVTDHSNLTWEWGNYVSYITTSGKTVINAHLASRNVSSGQKIKAGDVIGVMGNTGNANTGYKHVHFEVRNSPTGTGIDPSPYLGIKNAVGIYGDEGIDSSNIVSGLTQLTVGPASAGDIKTLDSLFETLQLSSTMGNNVLIIGPMTSGDMNTLLGKSTQLGIGISMSKDGDLYVLTIGPMSSGDLKTISELSQSLALPQNALATLTVSVTKGDAETIIAKAKELGLQVK